MFFMDEFLEREIPNMVHYIDKISVREKLKVKTIFYEFVSCSLLLVRRSQFIPPRPTSILAKSSLSCIEFSSNSSADSIRRTWSASGRCRSSCTPYRNRLRPKRAIRLAGTTRIRTSRRSSPPSKNETKSVPCLPRRRSRRRRTKVVIRRCSTRFVRAVRAPRARSPLPATGGAFHRRFCWRNISISRITEYPETVVRRR